LTPAVALLALLFQIPLTVSPALARSNRPIVGPEAPVTAESIRRPLGNNSPVLAADPADERFVALAARIDAPDYGCTLHLSGDGGRSWVQANPVPVLPKGAEKCYAPSIAFDSKGVLYYLFSGLSGISNGPMGVFITTSSDGGRTFSPPRKVLDAQSYMVQMVIDRDRGDRGRIHIVWVKAGVAPLPGGFSPGDNPIMATFSDDGGSNFTRPVRVSDQKRALAVRPALALGAGGVLHVAYYDLGEDKRDYLGLEGPVFEGAWALVGTRSLDGGRTFLPGKVIDDRLQAPERIMLIFNAPPPALTADDDGNVYVGWWDARNGDSDVFVRASKDGGRSWGSPVRVNDDPLKNGRNQYLPALLAAGGGRLEAVFYDRRLDPENLNNNVYYAHADDYGKRFSQNVRLTSESSDSRVGPTYDLLPSSKGLFEFGSHPALISGHKGVLVAAWTDTRNAESNRIQQNIVATTVHSFGKRDAFPLSTVLAVVLLLAGGIGVFTYRSSLWNPPSERRRRQPAAPRALAARSVK